MIDLKLIPKHLLKTLREDSELSDEQIARSSPKQLLNEILEWEGIFGFTNQICDALDDFNEAVVKPDPAQTEFPSLDVK